MARLSLGTLQKRRLKSFAVLLTLFGSGLNGQATANRTGVKRALSIHFVRNTSAFEEGGCQLWLPTGRSNSSERFIFLSDLENHAVMNINGRDVQLALVSSRDKESDLKKGDRSEFRYRGSGVEVVVRYVVTGLCAPKDERCEVTNYAGTITVTVGSVMRVLTAQGICGS
jgi:hypothetical protein